MSIFLRQRALAVSYLTPLELLTDCKVFRSDVSLKWELCLSEEVAILLGLLLESSSEFLRSLVLRRAVLLSFL